MFIFVSFVIKGKECQSWDDLDQIQMNAHMRRNNSDSIRTKDELKTKKIILREL